MLGLTEGAREELCNIAFPLCICRLTLAWISSEISTKLLGMPTHLDRSSFTGTGLLTSAVRCWLATRVTLRQLPSQSSFVQLLSRSLTHFRSRRDHELRPLFGFAPKQTKGSSAWRTTYIVYTGKIGHDDPSPLALGGVDVQHSWWLWLGIATDTREHSDQTMASIGFVDKEGRGNVFNNYVNILGAGENADVF